MVNPSGDETPNLEQLLQLGIQTAKKGNKSNARVIFQQIVDVDPANERAWLWMAATAENSEDRLSYLNAVLQINPKHPTALRELDKMKRKKVSSNSQVIRFGMFGLAALLVLVLMAVVIVAVLM